MIETLDISAVLSVRSIKNPDFAGSDIKVDDRQLAQKSKNERGNIATLRQSTVASVKSTIILDQDFYHRLPSWTHVHIAAAGSNGISSQDSLSHQSL